MRVSIRRVVTPGVRVRDGVAHHPGLGCTAATGSHDALELGLESQRVEVRLGRRRVALPPWVTPAARALPERLAPAVLATLAHQASGMAPLLAAAVATLAAGAVTASLGLAALGGLALGVLGSVLVHELGHVVAYRLFVGATAPAVVVTRGAACHIVRRAVGGRADVAVVVAGGAAPALVVAVASPLAAVAPGVVLLAALVALGHLGALALPVGDGASLRELAGRRRPALRRRRVSAAEAATRRRTRPRAG